MGTPEEDQRSVEAVREGERAAERSVAAGKDWEAKRKEAEAGGGYAKVREEQQGLCDDRTLAEFVADEIAKAESEHGDVIDIEFYLPKPLGGIHYAQEIEHETTHCLDRASTMVCGERASSYGPPSVTYAAIAQAWGAIDRVRLLRGRPEDGRDVIWKMVMMKAIRDTFKRKQDNLDDAAGYCQLGSWIGEPDAVR